MTTNNDRITIHRIITGEYVPRRATVTGGTFEEMKQCIKALPDARFEGKNISKSWYIRGDASAETIMAAGYTITPWPIVQVRVQDSAIIARDHIAQDALVQSCTAYLARMLPDGTYRSHDYLSLTLFTTADVLHHVQVEETARFHADGLTFDARPNAAWYRLFSAVLMQVDTQIQAVFNQMFFAGKRTEEAYREAYRQIGDITANEDDPRLTWAAVPDGDGWIVVDGADPRTVALVEHDYVRREAEAAQSRERAEAMHRDKLARAPEIVLAWLLADAKDDLLALAARRGIAVKKSATKKQIADLLVVDRAWCERNINSPFARDMVV